MFSWVMGKAQSLIEFFWRWDILEPLYEPVRRYLRNGQNADY